MRTRYVSCLSFLYFIFSAPAAQAFPELIRHHYVNCNACHVNPNGGGLLTEYGRGMSSEILSTWSYENESLFLHGALKPDKMPKWLNIGGDVRGVQTHRETRRVKEGKYILMQGQLEAGVTAGPVTAVAAFGKPDRENHLHGEFTRFYLLGNLSELVQVKAGRFLPAFGINVPQHIVATRQPLGFGYESERNAAEVHYSGEQWHLAIGGSESRMESAVRSQELAVNAQVERFFADKYRVGLNLWRGKSDTHRRLLVGAHGILGFTEKLYFMGEGAVQVKQALLPSAPEETGIFHFGRLGYELFKGFHLLAVEDIAETNRSNPSSLTMSYGGGLLWYPRPHFEFELLYTQRKALQVSREFEDYAYLMFHYYL